MIVIDEGKFKKLFESVAVSHGFSGKFWVTTDDILQALEASRLKVEGLDGLLYKVKLIPLDDLDTKTLAIDTTKINNRIHQAYALGASSRDGEVEALKVNVEEYDQLFELQQKRMEDIVPIWRESNGKDSSVIPDLGDLLLWLVKEIYVRDKALDNVCRKYNKLNRYGIPLSNRVNELQRANKERSQP